MRITRPARRSPALSPHQVPRHDRRLRAGGSTTGCTGPDGGTGISDSPGDTGAPGAYQCGDNGGEITMDVLGTDGKLRLNDRSLHGVWGGWHLCAHALSP